MLLSYTQSISTKYLLIIVCCSLLACTKNDSLAPTEIKEDSSLLLQTFVFEQKNNAYLKKEVAFEIQDNTISGPLKHFYFNAIPSFTTNAQSVEINGVQQVSGSSSVDFRKGVTYTLKSATGTTRNYTVKILWDNKLPQLTISTDGRQPINSKKEYVPTDITIDGQLKYSDFTGRAQIRGRGNSTWMFPKKPFKIKLEEEASIFGLAAEKDWVLLANYLDSSHLLNAVGMKIGQLLNMPFTNNMIPVEVSLNGASLGAYNLTEQIEVKKNRVNIGKEGLLLNLDTNFDEVNQFSSAAYRLPITIKYPKILDATELLAIRQEFLHLEELIASADFPNTSYLDYLDGPSVAKYLIVYMLTGNEEINHPKSTYLYKTSNGKFTMGPIWDFDWAYAFEGSLQHFSSFDRPLFWSPPSKGTQFFSKLLEDPAIQLLVKENWADFQTNQLPELLEYIDEYAFIIQGARTRDFALWGQGSNDFNQEVVRLKKWLGDRARYMNTYIGNL